MSAICRCTECDCERRDRDLDDATSSWVVCMSCCLDHHVYAEGKWCPTCEQPLPSYVSPDKAARIASRMATLA